MKIQLFGLGKQKQPCLIAREDGSIVEDDLEVLTGCAADHDEMQAWVLDAANQIRCKRTGLPTQVVCERDTAPLPISGIPNVKVTEANVNAIARETIAKTYVKIGRDAVKNKIIMGVMILVGMPCLCVMLVVAFMLWERRGGF